MKDSISRRDFVKSATAIILSSAAILFPDKEAGAQEIGYTSPIEARHYRKLEKK